MPPGRATLASNLGAGLMIMLEQAPPVPSVNRQKKLLHRIISRPNWICRNHLNRLHVLCVQVRLRLCAEGLANVPRKQEHLDSPDARRAGPIGPLLLAVAVGAVRVDRIRPACGRGLPPQGLPDVLAPRSCGNSGQGSEEASANP